MAAPTIKHKFESAKADGVDSTLVRPSNWNDDHDLATTQASVYLGQDRTGAGAALELPIEDDGVSDDYTIYTKAAVDAAIAAAIAALPAPGETGDLTASFAATRTSCLLLNGQTIGNVGSGAAYANAAAQSLFTLLWGLNSNTWPVGGGRGASAAADWGALKTVALPDARGCVIGMLDLAAGINTLIASMGIPVGEQNHLLITAEMPSHTHANGFTAGNTTPSTGGGNVHGGDPAATGATGGDTAHNNVQPTMGANIFVRL